MSEEKRENFKKKSLGQILHYKYQQEDQNFQYKECVVQIGLKKVLRPKWYRLLIDLINSDAKDVSEMIAVFAYYMFHVVNFMASDEGRRDHPQFFASLTMNVITKMFDDIRDGGGRFGFEAVRQRANMNGAFDWHGRSVLIRTMIAQFVVNWKTNITTHLQRRLCMFHSKVNPSTKNWDQKRIVKHVRNMMNTNSEGNEFGVNFKTNNPFLLLPMLVEINRRAASAILKHKELEELIPRGLRTFSISPLSSPGAKHVLYTRESLVELLNRQIRCENIRRKTQVS